MTGASVRYRLGTLFGMVALGLASTPLVAWMMFLMPGLGNGLALAIVVTALILAGLGLATVISTRGLPDYSPPRLVYGLNIMAIVVATLSFFLIALD